MSNVWRATKAAQYAASLIGILMLASIGIGQISFLNFYLTRFAFEPGPWFSEHLAPALADSNHCLIVGLSTAREGFDPAILERSVPGTKFLNGATTGGNIEVVEVQAQILARYGVHPKCVIVGVHPFLMTAEFPPLLASTGYLAHLGFPDVFLLSNRWLPRREFQQVAEAMVLPLKLHSDRLNKLVRYGMFRLQERFRSEPLSINAYEYFKDEFTSGANAHYDDIHEAPERVAELTRARYDNYTSFTSRIPVQSFRRALAMIRKRTGTVFVVSMPNQKALAGLNARGQARYDEALGEADVVQVDCSGLVSDEHFIDDAHLDKEGRRILSSAIGKIVTGATSNSAKKLSCSE